MHCSDSFLYMYRIYGSNVSKVTSKTVKVASKNGLEATRKLPAGFCLFWEATVTSVSLESLIFIPSVCPKIDRFYPLRALGIKALYGLGFYLLAFRKSGQNGVQLPVGQEPCLADEFLPRYAVLPRRF